MKIHIRNMVCGRCKTAVQNEFIKFGIQPIAVELGEVLINQDLGQETIRKLDAELNKIGFEILDDQKSQLTEKVKNTIIDLVHNKNSELEVNLSEYLARTIAHDYSAISALFSQQEGITIERYFILQKIERVKELLVYDEMNLNEIADHLNYSSASHLTKQFKKVTGLTPSYFKELKEIKRKALDDL